jgi:hypothetical protein
MTSQNATGRRRAPADLKARGRAFWRAIWADYELSDTETALLEEVCRTLDRLDSLAAAIDNLGPITLGSTGQTVVNPALTEARGQQVVLHRLIAALQLPDMDGQNVPSGRATAASIAAKTRWAVS